MLFQDMINAINRRVDDTVETADAIEWLNEAQAVMGLAVGAKFPLLEVNVTSTFVFDERYHHLPVIYACARYKEQDSALQEAANFQQQFEEQKREFVENYEIPARYREDRLSQQFIVEEGQTLFTITKTGYDPASGQLKVFVNDEETSNFVPHDDKTFMVSWVQKDDHVTAVWEEHVDMVRPPYPWWNRW